MPSSESKLAELSALKQSIVDNAVCPELAAQATNLVMGDGSVDATIVLIGEAPGKKEDEQGVPFVGAAGKFLNEMLLQAGMERNDVYITNIVKYRPPNNRDPSSEEKAAFLPCLLEQLRIIQPSVVVTLGRHSMEYFLPGAKISEVHGQIVQIELNGQPVTIAPLYHPAAALYNGSMRQTLVDDFLKIATFIQKQS